ncbi:MAG: hypothetical protein Q8Q31_05430 [Nanoarchaeota archaeon]|nr:hypothetical protein [Nanoarchaeota archaeon]
MKKDKYLRERGGTAKIIDVECSKCSSLLLTYQKDGPGWLKRCYLNRIISPPNMAELNKNPLIKSTADMPYLKCSCGEVIGSPMRYKDGRLAFHLIRGKFKRELNKELS